MDSQVLEQVGSCSVTLCLEKLAPYVESACNIESGYSDITKAIRKEACVLETSYY